MLVVTTTMRLNRHNVRMHTHISIMDESLTWSTGFIATPRVLGHEFRLTANLCLARDASRVSNQRLLQARLAKLDSLNNGLSVRPPPATIPIIPLALLLITFFAPLGNLTLVFASSGLWPITVT